MPAETDRDGDDHDHDHEQDHELVELAPRLRLRVIFARFWPETKPLRKYLVLIALLVMLGPAISTAITWLFKIMVDTVVVPASFTRFPRLALIFLGLALAQSMVSFADHYLSVWTGERFVLGLRSRLFAHLHRLAPEFLERRALGDVLTRLGDDVGAIEELLLSGAMQAASYLFELVFFTVALFVLDWRLAGAALVAAPGFLLVAQVFSRRIRDASRDKGRRTGGMSGVAEESLSNIALVRAYHRADLEQDRYDRQNQARFAARMTATRFEALFSPVTELLEVIGVLAVIALAVWELGQHRISIGGLLAFLAYLGQMWTPAQGLGELTNSVFTASAGADRVIELLDARPSIVEPANPRPLPRARGALRFEKVSFSYPGASRRTLERVDFTVEPGRTLAIVGASGAGKSTVAKLLLRFYDRDSGRITLDGIDLRQLSLADLYANVTAVLQETLVFDATVAENIGWGKPGATEQEIIDAARAADAHEFITELPRGYQTRIGQRGRLLSGGQRQRVAIARAVIRDAPVLILDEPTTGLDTQSSQRVLTPLRRLMSGRTTIIVSHDLLTVTDADQILLLDRGRVTGVGTHDELLASRPEYAELYRASRQPDRSNRGREAVELPAAAGNIAL